MDRRDQEAIEGLFERLAEAERRSPPRDQEAERFIRQAIGAQPAAPYYMAQTIVVQQQALETAQRRIEELEANSGGLFGGLFGGGQRQPAQAAQAAQPGRRGSVPQAGGAGPWANQGGGGFLAGAAQTAVGVAGGVLLGNLIGGALFGGSSAEAASQPEPQPEPEPADSGGDFDAGGDFDF